MSSNLTRARSVMRRLFSPEPHAALASLQAEVRRLSKHVEQLKEAQRNTVEQLKEAQRSALEQVRSVGTTATQLKLVSVLNRRHQQEIEALPTLLNESRIAEHVRRAVGGASLIADPYEHIVVEGVLPDDVYDLLIRAIPPVEFFDNRERFKQDLTFPMEYGPTLSAAVWGFMDDVVARRIVRPAVLEKFHDPLQNHFASMFGAAFVAQANALPQSASGGRLMRRRPGYHLKPHRDPKRAVLTCLMYLARAGDSETYGTQVFRVLDDAEADYKQTYYPEEDGRKCELVKVVPFTPNTMLVSLNSRGAHGATIPQDAPADLERYTYQFYVAPLNEALSAFVKSLPGDRRANWRSKELVRPEYA